MHVRDRRRGLRQAGIALAMLVMLGAWPARGVAEMVTLDEPVAVVVQRDRAVLRGELIAWGDEGLELRDGDGEVATVRWAELNPRHAAALHNRVLGGDATAEDYLAMARRISTIDHRQAGAVVRQAARRAMRMDEALTPEAEAVIAEWEASSRDEEAGDEDEETPEGGGAPGAATPEHLLWPALTDEEHKEAIEESLDFARRVATELDLPLQLYESEYFLLCTDLSPREAEQWFGLLDDMYRTLLRTFGQPPDENIWRGKAMVLLLATREDYHRLYQEIYDREDAGSAVGRCHYLSNGGVHITMFRGSRDRRAIEATLVHEATHGFVHRYRSRAGIPSWVNEGIAEWAEHTLIPTLPDVTPRVRERLRQRGSVEGVFEANQIDSWQYSVAHKLTDFLIQQNRGAYVDFFHGIKDGMEWEESLETHYGVTVERLLDAYARSLNLRDGLTR